MKIIIVFKNVSNVSKTDLGKFPNLDEKLLQQRKEIKIPYLSKYDLENRLVLLKYIHQFLNLRINTNLYILVYY